MKKTRSNLLISSVALIAALIIVFYLIMNMADHMELIIIFSLVAAVDTYFLMDNLLKRIDDITNTSIDKQTELTKVEKGIYSVAKREEANMNERFDSLFKMIEELQSENIRLNEELINQEKLFTKIIMKKNQENTIKTVNSSDRVAKLLVQLSSNNKDFSEETIDLLKELNKQLGNDIDEIEMSNVRVMTPRENKL